jgi:hypothetical protein
MVCRISSYTRSVSDGARMGVVMVFYLNSELDKIKSQLLKTDAANRPILQGMQGGLFAACGS